MGEQFSYEELVGMLHEAAELEHALCCQYLFAAWTLRRGGEPGVSAAAAAMAEQWDQQITKIAVQEMYHLLLVSNLLTAIGAEPHLQRPNFPQRASRFSEVGLPSELAAFSAETIGRLVCWEKPERPGWWTKQCAERAVAPTTAEKPPYSTIGQLYGYIDEALRQHPEWSDAANASRQMTSATIPFAPKVRPIITPADATSYIGIIVTEGEGEDGHAERRHHGERDQHHRRDHSTSRHPRHERGADPRRRHGRASRGRQLAGRQHGASSAGDDPRARNLRDGRQGIAKAGRCADVHAEQQYEPFIVRGVLKHLHTLHVARAERPGAHTGEQLALQCGLHVGRRAARSRCQHDDVGTTTEVRERSHDQPPSRANRNSAKRHGTTSPPLSTDPLARRLIVGVRLPRWLPWWRFVAPRTPSCAGSSTQPTTSGGR
jgi:hypothetical protein